MEGVIMVHTDKPLIVNGKRLDGRALNECRPIKMQLGVVDRADGSAQVSFGGTEAIVSVYGPRRLFPRFMQEPDSGIIRYRYNMAPFSTSDRVRPGSSRRGVEISKVSRLAFEPVVFLEDFPETTIDVFSEVIQADGSTRVTGLNAASMAMAAAGVPMKDLIAACSVGKIDGKLIVDLNGIEDNNSQADVAVAMIPERGLITLLQMDGVLTKEELFTLLDMVKEACTKILQMQRATLKEAYKIAKAEPSAMPQAAPSHAQHPKTDASAYEDKAEVSKTGDYVEVKEADGESEEEGDDEPIGY
jgi:exosome complex component RRP41